MKTVVEEFIDNLTKELLDKNEELIEYNFADYSDEEKSKHIYNVPYMIAVLTQKLEKCTSFINDIEYGWMIQDIQKGCCQGIADVIIHIENPKFDHDVPDYTAQYEDEYLPYEYVIEFDMEERYWGYCQCTDGDDGYNAEHKCCGRGCDWCAPAFRIIKKECIYRKNWEGNEADYWEMKEVLEEKSFNATQATKEIQRKAEKSRLERQLIEIQNKIKELD